MPGTSTGARMCLLGSMLSFLGSVRTSRTRPDFLSYIRMNPRPNSWSLSREANREYLQAVIACRNGKGVVECQNRGELLTIGPRVSDIGEQLSEVRRRWGRISDFVCRLGETGKLRCWMWAFGSLTT